MLDFEGLQIPPVWIFCSANVLRKTASPFLRVEMSLMHLLSLRFRSALILSLSLGSLATSLQDSANSVYHVEFFQA